MNPGDQFWFITWKQKGSEAVLPNREDLPVGKKKKKIIPRWNPKIRHLGRKMTKIQWTTHYHRRMNHWAWERTDASTLVMCVATKKVGTRSSNQFSKSEDKAYRARIRHITWSILITHASGISGDECCGPQSRVGTKNTRIELNWIHDAKGAKTHRFPEKMLEGREQSTTPRTNKHEFAYCHPADAEEEDPFYYVDHKVQQRRVAAHLRLQECGNTLVGWIDTKLKKIICHSCNEGYHTSPQSQFKFFQLYKVFKNYGSLKEKEPEMVLEASNKNAKMYLAVKENNWSDSKERKPDYKTRARAF